LERLRYHPGFPTKLQVGCPIWTQDKFDYLKRLPADKIMPTYKININLDIDMELTEAYVSR
jgi:hypothetical protein